METQDSRSAASPWITLAVVCIAIAVVLTAVAVTGYVVFLKNGSSIRALKPMEIQGRQVIITLLNGTETSISVEQIDLVKTERYNQQGFGSSLMMEGLSDMKSPPTPTPRPRLGEMGRLQVGKEPTPDISVPPTPTPTPPIKLRESPYPAKAITDAFSRIFDDERMYLYNMSVGTQSDRLHISVVTDSEREVFHAVEVVSKAYHLIAELGEEGVPEMIELQLVTTTSKPAGTFRIEPETAKSLVQDQMSVEQFYVRHVIF